MINDQQFHNLRKINLTLQNKGKQNQRYKEKKLSSIVDMNKGKKNYKKMNNSINIINNNANNGKNISQDKTLKRFKQQYSELFKRIAEDKRDLGNLNKIYKSHIFQTENNYYYQKSIDNKNLNKKSKLKNVINNIDSKKNKNNNINIFNINKKDNSTSTYNEPNSNFHNNNKDHNKVNVLDNNKTENLFKQKTSEKKSEKKKFIKIKKIESNDIMKNNKGNNNKNNNDYITVNQNNNMNRNKNEKLINKTIDNYLISNNLIDYKKLKVKKNEDNKKANNKKMNKKESITQNQKLYFINKNNNSNNHHTNNNNNNNNETLERNYIFDEIEEKKIKLIKINDLTSNNFHKNNSSSTIYYTPDNFYHNIRNFKKEEINNRGKNEKSNNRNVLYTENEKPENNKKKLFTIKKVYYYENNQQINSNKNININNKEKSENNYNDKPNMSLKNSERNTISYLNPEENNNNENKVFTLNELFNRPNASNNILTQRKDDYYKSTKSTKIETPKAYFYQITNDNLKNVDNNNKKKNILKKCKITINQSREMFKLKKDIEENDKYNTINDKINSNNYNNKDDVESTYDNKTSNSNIYYNKKKLYNISVPKTYTMNDLYCNNIFMNNMKDNQSTVSSKISYIDFNVSSIKKEKDNLALRNKKLIGTSRRKLSNSFYNEYNNDNINSHNNQNNIFTDKYSTLYSDNIYYKKKNISLLVSKDKNKVIPNNGGRNSLKYYNLINRFKSETPLLSSDNFWNNRDNHNYSNINTDINISKEKKLYIKPIQINSRSKHKIIHDSKDNSSKRIYKKKFSQNSLTSNSNNIFKINYSIESINLENNNNINTFNKANYTKKPIKIKKYNTNSINALITSPTAKLNVYNEDKSFDKSEKIHKKDNSNFKYFNEPDKLDVTENCSIISNYNIIEKSNFNCFYKKLYNYYIREPIKKFCFIEKVKINKNSRNNYNDNINSSYFSNNINKISRYENLEFNGKNIISKKNNTVGNYYSEKKINGSSINSEITKEKYEKKIIPNSESNTMKNKYNLVNSEKKIRILNIPKSNLFESNSYNINTFSNTKNKYESFYNYVNSTSKKKNKHDKQYSSSSNNDIELTKIIKICLATNKLNNIFLTKSESEDTEKKRSITEEKFTLGCSKLNNIFYKKSPLSNNFCYSHRMKIKSINNLIPKNKNNEKNQEETNMYDNDDKIIVNKKCKTYNLKNKKDSDLENDEVKNYIRVNNRNQNKIIKKTIINLLNILNINNLDSISRKLVDEILYIEYYINQNDIERQYIENGTILIDELFNRVSNDKCDLSLYCQLVNSINSTLLNELMNNNNNYNKECNLINIIIKEFYNRIDDKEYFNNIHIYDEDEFEILSNKITSLINFISKLISFKITKEKDNMNIIKKIFNEYEKNDNKIKKIFLRGIIQLFNSLLEVIYEVQITEDYLNNLENYIKGKLKTIIKDKNISYNLKNRITQIIEKFYEFKESKRRSKSNDIEKYFISIKTNETENQKGKINSHNIKNYEDKNEANNNKHIPEYCQDENGGGNSINNLMYNSNSDINFNEISFKVDNNKFSEKKKKSKVSHIQEKDVVLNNEPLNYINDKNDINTNKNKINTYDPKNNIKNSPTNNINNSHKKKSKSKKKSRSQDKKNLFIDNNKEGYILIITENEKPIYNQIKADFENYLKFLLNKGIKTKKDLYIDINYSYNWNTIDELIMVKKVKLEDIIKIIIDICKNKNDINKNEIFKINEYIKTIIEYYSNDLSNNQIEILHLNMIELYMAINNIVGNDSNSECMYEIMGNLLFILLKNKLYYIKDLNNFIDKSIETQINIAKVVKFTIIASGNCSKQYINDFKYTKLFNGSDLFVNYISNELTDIFKK